jgi:hypothetical protein
LPILVHGELLEPTVPQVLNLNRASSDVERLIGASQPDRQGRCVEATVVTDPSGMPRVRLSRLGWGLGVGWYAQQSLELDLREAQELARLLTQAPKHDPAAPNASRAPASLASFRERRARERSGGR